MTEYISETKTIAKSEECIYTMLSDLENLEKIKDRIPQDKIKGFTFDSDSCAFEVSPVGKIAFQIVEREPNKTIKFKTVNSPVPLFLWIQLKESQAEETKMRLTIRAELSPMLKPMLNKPLQDAIDKAATLIASLPYE